jgi:hypothetical protein
METTNALELRDENKYPDDNVLKSILDVIPKLVARS